MPRGTSVFVAVAPLIALIERDGEGLPDLFQLAKADSKFVAVFAL
jgi:hypothetical protein